jgi:hypothetical protein
MIIFAQQKGITTVAMPNLLKVLFFMKCKSTKKIDSVLKKDRENGNVPYMKMIIRILRD